MAKRNFDPWGWSKKQLTPILQDEHPLDALHRQMNSMMEDFWSGIGIEPLASKGFAPRANVSEDREKIYVSVELPGLTENEVELTLTRDALTIRGEKKEELEEREGRNLYRCERSFGTFQREIPLTAEVDEDKVDAVFKNGVLTITLNKTVEAQAQAKKIPIRR